MSQVLRLPGLTAVSGLDPEWAFAGATGQGVRVAVVDSGVEAGHPSLGSAVDAAAGVAFAVAEGGQVERRDGPHDDAFGHGTACAGIVHELAPEAQIVSVRVLGADGSGKAAAFLAGLEWAVDAGFDVINLSLGTRKRDWALAFYQACDRAYFAGSFVVTAANNVLRESYPSLAGSVASVACNLATDPWRFHWNPEPPTEFLARGVDVDVAWRGGARSTVTGNSYAAPHIAGLAALVLSKHRGLRPFQVKSALWAAAANVVEAPVAAGRRTRLGASPPGRDRATRVTGLIRPASPAAPEKR